MQGSPMGAEYSMWMARRTDGWTDGWTDGQTDMTKLKVTINNFANVPKWRI